MSNLPDPDRTNREAKLKEPSGGGAVAGNPAAEIGNQRELEFATLSDNKWDAKNAQGDKRDYTQTITNTDGQIAAWKFKYIRSV